MSGWRLENLVVTRFSGLAPRVFMPTGAGDLLINCSPPDSGSASLLLRRRRAVHCHAEPIDLIRIEIPPPLLRLLFPDASLRRDGFWSLSGDTLPRSREVSAGDTVMRVIDRISDQAARLESDTGTLLDAFSRLGALSRPARVSEWAAACGVSSRTLERTMQRIAALSPKEYLRIARINLLVNRLRGRPADLPAAASACGFSDQSHMAREVSAIIGTTTRKLRELIRSGAVMDSVSECRGLSSCDTLSENLKNLHDGSDLFRRGHR